LIFLIFVAILDTVDLLISTVKIENINVPEITVLDIFGNNMILRKKKNIIVVANIFQNV